MTTETTPLEPTGTKLTDEEALIRFLEEELESQFPAEQIKLYLMKEEAEMILEALLFHKEMNTL